MTNRIEGMKKMINRPNKAGHLKGPDGKDVIILPDEDGTPIVFNQRKANCSCYVSDDGTKAVIGTLWGNIILDVPAEKLVLSKGD